MLGQVCPRSGSDLFQTPAGRVVVTPLTSQPTAQAVSSAVRSLAIINKVLIKAFVKGSKKDFKMFTIRNINTDEVHFVDKLQKEVRNQLTEEESQNKFDAGYLQGTDFVTVRNAEDLAEVWTSIKKGTNVILWCDGLKNMKSTHGRNRVVSSNVSEDDNEDVHAVYKIH